MYYTAIQTLIIGVDLADAPLMENAEIRKESTTRKNSHAHEQRRMEPHEGPSWRRDHPGRHGWGVSGDAWNGV